MRFFAPIFSVLAAVALAQSQCNTNCILIPNSGLQVTAGQTFTLKWSNPSAGQMEIKLQPSTAITPSSGYTLASSIDASLGTYTVTIPSDLPNSDSYTFETIDLLNPSNINFSNMFSISGATGAMSSASASSTGTASSSASSSGSMTATSMSSSASSTSSGSSSSSASHTTMTSMTSTSSSASSSSAAATTVPNSNSNGASSLKVEGAWIALVAGLVAAL